MRCCYVFFFKQKTAYEMRISDWSSDVCSSDLRLSARPFVAAPIYPVQSMHAPLAHPGSRALLIGANASRALESSHTPAENVPPDAPSLFLCHAEADAPDPGERKSGRGGTIVAIIGELGGRLAIEQKNKQEVLNTT